MIRLKQLIEQITTPDKRKGFQSVVSIQPMIFPIVVNGSFRGDNGDKSHAFQSTGGVVVGGMLTKVNAELKKVYDAGYNPDVTNVTATINKTTKTTSWEVTINKSTDGKAWIGLVTAGSCCSKNFETRADGQVAAMKTWNAPAENHKLVTILKTTDDGKSAGNITIEGGSYRLKQYFYKYWKSSKKPH